jgi:toxin ParE1/3/4
MKWLSEALEDLETLHQFLRDVSPDAAMRAAQAILEGADQLDQDPQMGKPTEGETREWYIPFSVAAYVLRYRIDAEGHPVVIRVWHSREAQR